MVPADLTALGSDLAVELVFVPANGTAVRSVPRLPAGLDLAALFVLEEELLSAWIEGTHLRGSAPAPILITAAELVMRHVQELRSGGPPPGVRSWAEFREDYTCWERIARRAQTEEGRAVPGTEAFALLTRWSALSEFVQLVVMLQHAPPSSAEPEVRRATIRVPGATSWADESAVGRHVLQALQALAGPVEDLPRTVDDDLAKVNANLQDLRDELVAVAKDLEAAVARGALGGRGLAVRVHRLQQNALGWIYFLFLYEQDTGPSANVAVVQRAGRRIVRAALLAEELASMLQAPDSGLAGRLRAWTADVSARGGPEDCLGAGEAVVAEAALAVCAGKRRSVGSWAELQQQMYMAAHLLNVLRARHNAFDDWSFGAPSRAGRAPRSKAKRKDRGTKADVVPAPTEEAGEAKATKKKKRKSKRAGPAAEEAAEEEAVEAAGEEPGKDAAEEAAGEPAPEAEEAPSAQGSLDMTSLGSVAEEEESRHPAVAALGGRRERQRRRLVPGGAPEARACPR